MAAPGCPHTIGSCVHRRCTRRVTFGLRYTPRQACSLRRAAGDRGGGPRRQRARGWAAGTVDGRGGMDQVATSTRSAAGAGWTRRSAHARRRARRTAHARRREPPPAGVVPGRPRRARTARRRRSPPRPSGARAQLADAHYENFSVVSLLLPRHLRQDFCNIYAFCRVADDLGDELADRDASTAALADLRAQTLACRDGQADTMLFVALRRDDAAARHPRRAAARPDRRVRAGPARHALRDVRASRRLLPPQRQSRRPARALPLRVPRRAAAAAERRDVHGAATGQLLAGRPPRPARPRPHLPARRRPPPLRRQRGRPARRHPPRHAAARRTRG